MTSIREPYIVVGKNENVQVIIASYYYKSSARKCAKSINNSKDYEQCLIYFDDSNSEDITFDKCIMIYQKGRLIDSKVSNINNFNRFQQGYLRG